MDNASHSCYCGIATNTVQQSQKQYALNTSQKEVNASETRSLIMLQN